MDSRPDDDQFNSPLPANRSDLDELTSASDEDDRGATRLPQESEGPVAACTPHPHCTGNDFIVRIRPGSNIIIVSTPKEETAQVLRRVVTLTLGGKNYEFNTYVAAPEGTLRDVIHGIDSGTPPEELLASPRVRTQVVKVHSARMLGDIDTAVITYDGTMIP
ncbi:hypothetical protein MTO96_047517 [Rhipicephalus appendiculatus]